MSRTELMSPRRSSALVEISALSHFLRMSSKRPESWSAHSSFRAGYSRFRSFLRFSALMGGMSMTAKRETRASFSSLVPA